jgi:transposase
MIKSIRYTSKYLNKDKLAKIKEIDSLVLQVKKEMSNFIFKNLNSFILNPKEFQQNYKQFKIPEISAWETQTLFQDILGFYDNRILVQKQKQYFGVQSKIKIEKYKVNTKLNKKGDLKSFEVSFKQTELTKLVKYLTYIDLDRIEAIMLSSKLKDIYLYFSSKLYFSRVLDLVKQKQTNLIRKINLINFSTGTYRKSPSENGSTLSSSIYVDETNEEYKTWFKYKIPGGRIDIPLQINRKYHNKELRRSEFYIKVNNNKVDIISTYESKELCFKEFSEVLGCDLNVKHNFASFSNGLVIDYDRKYIEEAVSQLKKLDKVGTRNFNDLDKRRLSKIVKKNEWYFKKLISETLDELEKQGITDLVMEDLTLFNKTFIKSVEFDVKYSRLVRLLRLSNIKNWMFSQAEKRGIKVHVTKPHYSSQQCPHCGHISRDNRKSQEEFRCVECGHSNNADLNSSINLKRRYVSDVLNSKLHLKDDYNRLIPKSFLKKETIKLILFESFK